MFLFWGKERKKMKVKEAVELVKHLGATEEDLSLKAEISKRFMSGRDRNLIPSPSGIKQQKFVLFYSLFLYVKNNNEAKYTLKSLKAFPQGPVYEDVYELAQQNIYVNDLKVAIKYDIDSEVLRVTMLLMYLFDEKGISDITHNLDIWKDVKLGNKCNIDVNGLTENDRKIIITLYAELKEADEKFVFHKNYNNIPMLIQKENYRLIMSTYLGKINEYYYPDAELVYVYLNEGELVFD